MELKFAFTLIIGLLLCICPIAVTAASDAVLVLHFDEGSGNIAHDSSGHGNDGTIYGATWVDGVSGKALRFNGNSDFVEINPRSDVSSIGDFTISVWTYLEGKRPQSTEEFNYMYIFDGNSVSKTAPRASIFAEGFGIFYYVYSSRDELHNFITYTSTNFLEQNTPVTLKRKWVNVVFQRKGRTDYTYLNGELISPTYTSHRYASDNSLNMQHYWYIGTFAGDNPNYPRSYNYFGIIDEIAIYPRALSASEIQFQYNARKADATPTPTPSPTPTPAPTTPRPAVGATLTKSVNPQIVKQNQTVTITVTIENTGTTPLSDIEVIDKIPTEFNFISGDTQSAYSSLKPGESRTIQYAIQSRGSGKFTLDAATARYADQSRNYKTINSNTPTIEVLAPLSEQPITTKSPGFGVGVSIIGLLALLVLLNKKR